MSVRQRRQAGRCYHPQFIEEQLPPWFKGLPPERVGLDGEYDYYGLAKRVQSHLRDSVDRSLTQTLKVSQRGRVIVLSGVLPSEDVLQWLTQLVTTVPGVDMVEACAVKLADKSLVSAA